MRTSSSISLVDGSTTGAASEMPLLRSGSDAPPSRSADAAPPSDLMRYLTAQRAALLKIFRPDQLHESAVNSSESTAAAALPPNAPPHMCEEDEHDFKGAPVVVAADRPWTPLPAWTTALPYFTSDKNPFNTFLSYLAVLGVYLAGERMTDPSAPMQNSGCGSMAEEGGSVSAAPDDRAPLTTSSPMHTHQLRPTQFFLPTLCEVCVTAMVKERIWPKPQSQQTTSMSTPPSDTASSSTPSAGWTGVATAPSQPFLGFGTEGYRCCICGLVLHFHCITKMRQTQPCEVLAPAAHQMPPLSSTSASSSPSPSAFPTLPATASGIAVSSATSGRFSWDRVKTMFGSYLDPDDSTFSRHDANAKAVLAGVRTLIETVIARYPTLTPLTFVKRYPAMQDLGNAHQALYAACVASLEDTSLLRSINWDAVQLHGQARTGIAAVTSSTPVLAAMRPLRVDKSLFANLKASVSGKGFFSPSFLKKDATTTMTAQWAASDGNEDVVPPAWPVARYPVQLLLWQAMRYATAVYGEVYQRGSLSSALSATLLFTLNRNIVDVSKQANDAAVTTLLELPPSALRLSRWSSQTVEPSYALLVDDAAGRIVVSFRGTLNTFDIMTDLAASTQPFCGGYAHQGAVEVVSALFDQRASRHEERAEVQREKTTVAASTGEAVTHATSISAEDAERCASERAATTSTYAAERVVGAEELTSFRATGGEANDAGTPEAATGSVMSALKPYALQPLDTPDSLLDGLEQLAAEHPSYSILLTGHSLGGGVALLFATRLHYDQVLPPAILKRIHVIAFAPMPTLSLPAASCFDEVSCARADGGYNYRDAPQQRAPGAACFPVWSVVNGFDCVPRLQLNTIDRLLRQVVGPETASSAEVSPATGSSTTAPAAAGARDQVLRGSHKQDAAGCGAATEASEETEMTGMSALPTEADTMEVPSPRLESDAVTTAMDDGVEDVAPASVFEMSDMRTASGIAGAEVASATIEETDVVARGSNGKRSTSAFRAPLSVSFAGSKAPRLDELCTPVSDGAQGASSVRCSPPKSEDRRHNARSLSHELHHPGRVLLLTSPWDVITNRLVDVPRGHPVMHELFLMKSMLMQHMADAYSASLEEIHEDPRRSSGDERS